MKILTLLPALGLFALGGCLLLPPAVPIAPSPSPGARTSTASAPPVRAEQVTPQTAHIASQALADELDREAQQTISTPAP
jgi:hypothetical protein